MFLHTDSDLLGVKWGPGTCTIKNMMLFKMPWEHILKSKDFNYKTSRDESAVRAGVPNEGLLLILKY